MPQIVALHFSDRDMALRFDPSDLSDLKPEEYVVARRGEGEDVGRIAAIEWVSTQQLKLRREPYARLVRRATEQERAEFAIRRGVERKALALCKSKSAELGLPMKISHARLESAEAKIVFHFTSDQRVDFRQLVRELAAALKVRVELWQIGVRDEAKMLDGLGICGQRTCCSQWLDGFHPINIRMAKQQDINLPPAKLSGQCGRLLCCLSYEVDQYKEMSKTLLPKGATVRVDGNEGVIIDRNILVQTYLVSLGPGRLVTVKAEQVSDVRVPEQMKTMARVLKPDSGGEGEVPDSGAPASRGATPPRPAGRSAAGSADPVPSPSSAKPPRPPKARPAPVPAPDDAGEEETDDTAAPAGPDGTRKKRRRRRKSRKGSAADGAEARPQQPSRPGPPPADVSGPRDAEGEDDDGGDDGPEATADSEGAKSAGRKRRRRRGRRGGRGGGEGAAPPPAGG